MEAKYGGRKIVIGSGLNWCIARTAYPFLAGVPWKTRLSPQADKTNERRKSSASIYRSLLLLLPPTNCQLPYLN